MGREGFVQYRSTVTLSPESVKSSVVDLARNRRGAISSQTTQRGKKTAVH